MQTIKQIRLYTVNLLKISTLLSTFCLISCNGAGNNNMSPGSNKQQIQISGSLNDVTGPSPTIFVTNNTFDGGFSGTGIYGVSGADNSCNGDSMNPHNGATYKAMIISGGNRSAIPNINWVLQPNTTYTRLDGGIIGTTNTSAVFDFPLSNPISDNSKYIWTGSTSSWGSGNNCQNWLTNDMHYTGEIGLANQTGNSALNARNIYGGLASCNYRFSLYCVEQPVAVSITTNPKSDINIMEGTSYTININYTGKYSGTVNFSNANTNDNPNITYEPSSCNVSSTQTSCVIKVNVAFTTPVGSYTTNISSTGFISLSTTSISFNVDLAPIIVESLPEDMHLGSAWTDTLMHTPVGQFGLTGYLITNETSAAVNLINLININVLFPTSITVTIPPPPYEFWIDGFRSSCYQQVAPDLFSSITLSPKSQCSIVIHYQPTLSGENGVLTFTVADTNTENNSQQVSQPVNTPYSSRPN